MKLDHVSDHDLLCQVGKLMGSQRELTAKLVACLAEIEQRNLHLVAGYSSLFEFCLKELRMSEGAAYRRMTAARISRRFPIVLSLLASGEVHLSALELLRDWLTEANHAELLEAATGKTKREIEQLLAARFPTADVPDRIRPCPQPRDESAHSESRIQPLSERRYSVEFTASAELREKLELARDLLSHANPSRALEVVIERAVDLLIAELERRKLGKAKRPLRRATRQSAQAAEATASGVTRATRREVAARDGLCCTYVSPDGRRCTARAFLEFDHVEPRALGGDDGAHNVRIRCRSHNQLWAEQCFGREHVRARRNLRQHKRPSPPDSGAPVDVETARARSEVSANYEKVKSALTNLGFRDSESRRVVGELARRHGGESEPVGLEQLLREALLAFDTPRASRR